MIAKILWQTMTSGSNRRSENLIIPEAIEKSRYAKKDAARAFHQGQEDNNLHQQAGYTKATPPPIIDDTKSCKMGGDHIRRGDNTPVSLLQGGLLLMPS